MLDYRSVNQMDVNVQSFHWFRNVYKQKRRNSETLIFPILIVLQLKMFDNVCMNLHDMI